jgi:hypothetical protein
MDVFYPKYYYTMALRYLLLYLLVVILYLLTTVTYPCVSNHFVHRTPPDSVSVYFLLLPLHSS